MRPVANDAVSEAERIRACPHRDQAARNLARKQGVEEARSRGVEEAAREDHRRDAETPSKTPQKKEKRRGR
jgi:hypothetical protein